MPIPSWTAPLFKAIDSGDWKSFGEFLTDQATFRYGSFPAVHGRDAIRQAAAQAVAPFAKVWHELQAGWEAPGSCVLQGEVNYQLPNGTIHRLPFVNIFRMEGRLVQDYLIYIDPSPLMAP
ncbi:MAG TPA: nuclear transport factor 2 family protein [Gemmatimonadales bacterium]|nr:nuclear transport factor 2 family protein [Gemmatimonadales bacterium]